MTNYMKATIKYFGTLLAASMFFVSCEGLLDRFPQDKLSPETFLANETEMQTYTNSYYTMFLGAGDMYNEFSDVVIGTDLSQALWGGRTITSGEGAWSWTVLRKLNTFFEYADNCKDEKVRNQYIALTRFFRAYFYFEKVKTFGDVPWYDRTLGSDDPELNRPRDSRDFVMQKMIEDIDFAIEWLPETKSDYRVTKWTALAFKSRFCLYEGTFRKYHEGKETLKTLPADAQPYSYYLTLAAAAADQFMTGSGYTLYTTGDPKTSYLELFNKHSVTEGPNKEVILARNYDIQYGVVHSANASYQSATLGRPGLTRKLVASYLMKDGSRFTDKAGWETMTFMQETKDRDPRLAQSIRTTGFCRVGETTPVAPQLGYTVTGYAPIKYMTSAADDTYQTAYVDMPIFRAAEVYLNFAEAKAELGTLSQADLDRSINLIRSRVGMPALNMANANANPDKYLLDKHTGYPQVAVKNSSNVGVILEIRRERTIELLQEGFRYYDVIRWAEGATFETPLQGMYFPGEGTYDLNEDGTPDVTLYTSETAPADAAALAYKLPDGLKLSEGTKGYIDFHRDTRPGWKWNETKDYYYPIPVGDRNLTGGALTQNPGWNDGLSF